MGPVSTQICIFIIEYSLFQVWIDFGIKPSSVIGHSLGEYCAACVSGFISLKDALFLVYQRALLMNSLEEKGEMIAISASRSEVQQMINSTPQNDNSLCISAVN